MQFFFLNQHLNVGKFHKKSKKKVCQTLHPHRIQINDQNLSKSTDTLLKLQEPILIQPE